MYYGQSYITAFRIFFARTLKMVVLLIFHCAQARKHASEGSTLVLKPRADVTKSPERCQWSHKKSCVLQKCFKKRRITNLVDQQWVGWDILDGNCPGNRTCLWNPNRKKEPDVHKDLPLSSTSILPYCHDTEDLVCSGQVDKYSTVPNIFIIKIALVALFVWTQSTSLWTHSTRN